MSFRKPQESREALQGAYSALGGMHTALEAANRVALVSMAFGVAGMHAAKLATIQVIHSFLAPMHALCPMPCTLLITYTVTPHLYHLFGVPSLFQI